MLRRKMRTRWACTLLLVLMAAIGFALTSPQYASAETGLWMENDLIKLEIYSWGSDDFQYPHGSNNLYRNGGQRYAVRYGEVFKWSLDANTIPGNAPVLSTLEETHFLVNIPEMMVAENSMGDDTVEVNTRITILADSKWVGLEYTIKNISANPIDLQFYEGDDFDVDHVSSANDVGKYDNMFRLLMEWDNDGFPYVGVAAVTPHTNHDVGYYDDVWGRILNDNLANREYFAGDPAIAFEWEVGTLQPGESTTILKVMAAGASEADLEAEIEAGIDWLIALPATIDIKPGGYPNAININSKGNVPIAILTADGLDASNVNPDTITIGTASPSSYSYEDVDGDGDIDLMLHFRTQALAISEDATELVLFGQTFDGQWLIGTDSIKVLTGGKGQNGKTVHLQPGLYNVGVSDCDVAAISGNIIAIAMDEGEDSTDYNNDGDTRDDVLGYYDIRAKKLTNTGIAIGRSVAIDGDIIAFELDGYNGTLAYYSISKGKLYDTGIKPYRFGRSHRTATRVVSDGKIVYNTSGSELCVYDTRTQSSTCTGTYGSDPSISGDIIAYTTGSYYSGSINYYDMRTGEAFDTTINGRYPTVDDGIIVFESSSGIGYYDTSRGTYVETAIADGYSASISDGLISSFVNERDWGDLNGDGDAYDNYMVMVYDIRTGELINTGVQGCCGTDISNGVIVFDKYEGQDNIDIDYNGDGDTGDCVQHYLVLDLRRSRH
jgi:hypothetical protein